MMHKEEQAFGELMQEVMDHLNITEQEFMMTQQTYMQNPQASQILMQAQMAPNTNGEAPKLTKQSTKKYFLEQEEKKMDSLKKMMTNP